MYYNADSILILTSKGMSYGCFLGISVDRGEFECTLLVVFFLLTLNLAAGYLCSVKTQLYEQWIFIGVNAVGQGCCHLVLHSSTKQEPKRFALNLAAGYLCSVKT